MPKLQNEPSPLFGVDATSLSLPLFSQLPFNSRRTNNGVKLYRYTSVSRQLKDANSNKGTQNCHRHLREKDAIQEPARSSGHQRGLRLTPDLPYHFVRLPDFFRGLRRSLWIAQTQGHGNHNLSIRFNNFFVSDRFVMSCTRCLRTV